MNKKNNTPDKTEANTKITKIIKKICILAIICAVLLPFFLYENKHLVVSEYTYSSDKTDSALDGFKIVQISDLHNACFGKNNERLLGKIEELNPDIIVLTGDLVDSKHTNINSALKFAGNAVKICPVYYITGNHEYALSDEKRERLLTGLEECGVTVLYNEMVTISKNGASFNLTGLDDNYITGSTLSGLLTGHENELNVVLAHEPQFIKSYSNAGSDLVLAGHAHGGQFRLPIIGAVYAPGQGLNPEYTEGIYTRNNTTMIVSRGLGNSVIPVRLFNDPEIVCVTLESK